MEAAGEGERGAAGERDPEAEDLRVGVKERHHAVHDIVGCTAGHVPRRALRHQEELPVAPLHPARRVGRARGEDDEEEILGLDRCVRIRVGKPGERLLEGGTGGWRFAARRLVPARRDQQVWRVDLGEQTRKLPLGQHDLAVAVRDVACEVRAAAGRVEPDHHPARERGAQLREHELGTVLEQEAYVEGPRRIAQREEQVRVAARGAVGLRVGQP